MGIFEIDEFTKWKILSKDISTQEEAEKYVKEKFGDNIRAYVFLELVDSQKDRSDIRSFRTYDGIELYDGSTIVLSSNDLDENEHLLLLIPKEGE